MIRCTILVVNSLVSRIVMEVAERERVDPLELPPLFEAIDTEALAILLEGDDVRVSFTYCGYRITVTSDEQLTIEPSKIQID